MLCIVCTCFAQKNKWKSYPNLEIKTLHEWEQLIQETSINYLSVDMESKELDRTIHEIEKNTFILHYKIATVSCHTTIYDNTGVTKHEFKDYTLQYNEKGNLVEMDEGSYRFFYYYDEKGVVDSTAVQVYAMGGEAKGIRFPAAKDFKTWDKVKGKTSWTRLVERELYSAVYYKRKKTEYSFLAKIEYSYVRDGLLAEMKSFNEEGKLILQEKFSYTFYK